MKAAHVVPASVATALETSHEVICLSHRARRLVWSLLVTVQLLTAALLVLLAIIYFQHDTPHSLLWTTAIYFIFAESYVFINRFSVTVATGYAILGTAFSFNTLRLVWLSVKSRHLSFGAAMRWTGANRNQVPDDSPARAVGQQRRTSSIYESISRSLSHSSSTFSVHGSHFEIRQLLSATAALASQTVAAYLSSRSISNVYLNLTYGFVIFFYGISTLVYSRLFDRNQLVQRFAGLLTDVVLDFVWGCVLPLWMHYPIIRLYRSASGESMSDGESTAREIRRVFVLSWPSYLISIFPFAKSLLTLLELQTMLRDDVRWKRSSSFARTQQPNFHLLRSRWFRCARALLAIYGCVLLGISLSAADIFSRIQRQPHYRCTFRLHPWFSNKEACVKRTIDCASVGIVGNAAELEAALDLLDEGSLSDLSFADCEAFTMPTTLSRFPTLETIIVESSWISSWPLEAALSDEKFSHLKTVKLIEVDTNVTLHGLVSAPLASTVEYIRFNRVPNATAILAPVGDNWQHLVYFDCDRCDLTDVPMAVDSMYQLLTLSLVESNISVLRDDFITRWDLRLVGIWLDGNSELTELSDNVWRQAATCDVFTVQNTSLSAIPDWVPDVTHATSFVYAFGTPLCDSDKSLLASMAPDVRALVVCDETDNS